MSESGDNEPQTENRGINVYHKHNHSALGKSGHGFRQTGPGKYVDSEGTKYHEVAHSSSSESHHLYREGLCHAHSVTSFGGGRSPIKSGSLYDTYLKKKSACGLSHTALRGHTTGTSPLKSRAATACSSGSKQYV